MSRWERISVELSHSWPGEAYLRFQAANGTATMVAVDEDDLARLGALTNAVSSPQGVHDAIADEIEARHDEWTVSGHRGPIPRDSQGRLDGMPIGRVVEAKAQDGTMTLGELREFVAELDHAGAAETTRINATVRLGGGLKGLKATAVRLGDPEQGC